MHRHTSELGTDTSRNTYFLNWDTADGELCCDLNHEPAAEGTVKAPYDTVLYFCGKGKRTFPPWDTCASFPDASLISPPGNVTVFPLLSRHPGGRLFYHTMLLTRPTEPLVNGWVKKNSFQVKPLMDRFTTSVDSPSLQPLQLVALLRRWKESYKTMNRYTRNQWITHACTTSRYAWSIKSTWDFAGLTLKRSLGETMPLKYRVYNQSFSFGS